MATLEALQVDFIRNSAGDILVEQYINPVSKVYLSNTCYTNCTNITSVNLHNIPWVNNSMVNAFYNCKSLVGVSNISSSVTNMFSTFQSCSNLVNAPAIPDSVTNMSGTFSGCTNLIGNIYICSENITNATDCFNNTSLTKNVYIPFTYDNGVNTKTYNAFTSAGYTTTGTTNGVYLKDIMATYYTLTVNGIGSGAVGTISINNVLHYNRSGYAGDSGNFTGTFAKNSTVEIHWGVEIVKDDVPTMSINNTQVASGNPMQYTFTLTEDTTVTIRQ